MTALPPWDRSASVAPPAGPLAAGSASAHRPPRPTTAVAGAAGRWGPRRADAPPGRCPALARRRRARESGLSEREGERGRGRRPDANDDGGGPELVVVVGGGAEAARELHQSRLARARRPSHAARPPAAGPSQDPRRRGRARRIDSAEHGNEVAAAAIRFGPAELLHGPEQDRRRSAGEGGLEADARCARRRSSSEREREQAAAGAPPSGYAAGSGQLEETRTAVAAAGRGREGWPEMELRAHTN
ncbi:unnamed protein product [Urochloa humidicola]